MDLHPPEGDSHSTAKDGATSALREFFRRIGRKIYISKELSTYYPNEAIFCPDVLAVCSSSFEAHMTRGRRRPD